MGLFTRRMLGGVVVAALMLGPSIVLAENFFVITATSDSQARAQKWAAENGGWVLDTDAYSALTPNQFAVVRGPFKTAKLAESRLATLKSGAAYKGAYVKHAGAPRLPTNLGNAVPAVALAVLLGEISVAIEDHTGGSNPCEPQEPYQSVSLSYAGLSRRYDPATDSYPVASERVPIDVGSFSIIKRTGELDRMRACYE
jgi:hypothetical protein